MCVYVLSFVFSLVWVEKNLALKKIKEVYKKLKNTVDTFLSMSSYSEVNLGKLFQTICTAKYVGDASNERQ